MKFYEGNKEGCKSTCQENLAKQELGEACAPNDSDLYLFLFSIFWLWILVPQPGVEPMSPAVEVQFLNHWTNSGIPETDL